ncbi:sigma 54-interacting transcriptional regulator [Desulfurivibrio dismutans]|uniref:sigma 54-interacting transcriptional regulator n=1 Tax=Desulfurivibrio dismutans TaxID=1398908 RepID=UPI0023DB1051|nr:sigma 54-interacting transcriptional regulator [Desulfurivibrio alkaliphilus]MDF1615530.1 sigma 54-interacting transcriptional regulator [Desulfurivibrio alkaliphilus]
MAQAHQGTLFLDEVGEMPLAAQKVFLRVLQEQRFRPVGGAKERVSNFRLVAATNRDLEEMVAHKTFRQDLLFRLRGFNCQLPPLRERGEDVIDLAMAHLAKLCRYNQRPVKGLCPQFLATLQQYDWPGNVRELINVITTAFAHAGDESILYSIHLPAEIRARAKSLEVQNDCRMEAGAASDNLLPGQDQARSLTHQHRPHQATEAPLYPAAASSVSPSPPTPSSPSSPSSSSSSASPSTSATLSAPPDRTAAEPNGRRFADGQPLPGLQAAREAAIKELEQDYLAALLSRTNKDMQQACALSGLSLSQLYRLLRKHRLK